MSQNGKIGRGWYEDVVGDETDELKILATDLLKDKLREVFSLGKDRRHEKEIMLKRERKKDDET